jgi:transposase-like protein
LSVFYAGCCKIKDNRNPAKSGGELLLSLKQLKKALIERALGAELTDHLGYEKGDPAGRGKGNSRNGTSSKTVLTEMARSRLRCHAIGPAVSNRS